MKNTEAAYILRDFLETTRYPGSGWQCGGNRRTALEKAITALEHQPEPYLDFTAAANEILRNANPPTVQSLQCICGWRTLDTHRLLCDSCGGHELKPVYEVGK
jgi:hypothetical protein